MTTDHRSGSITPYLCAAGLAILFSASQGIAQGIISTFERVGARESLTVPFTSPSVSTVHAYGQFVEIIVSGTGDSKGTNVNDAFYGVPSGVPYLTSGNKPGFYQLNIGWANGFGLAGCQGVPHNITNFITFIDGSGFVTPLATPPYAGTTHMYDFVVQVPADAGQLNFGVSDCNYSDNSGAYEIQVFQLGTHPAPALGHAGLVVLAVGLLMVGLAIVVRRRPIGGVPMRG